MEKYTECDSTSDKRYLSEKERFKDQLSNLLKKHDIELINIELGRSSKETRAWYVTIKHPISGIQAYQVNINPGVKLYDSEVIKDVIHRLMYAVVDDTHKDGVDEDQLRKLVQQAIVSPSEVSYDELLGACKGLLGELKRYREGTVWPGCEELSCGAKNEVTLGVLMDQLDMDNF